MNYFAHGFRYLDNPWFLAGTAVPDWLSVADRKVRLRAPAVERFVGEPTPEGEVAAGVLQHLEDDLWFHRSPGFLETSREITVLLRDLLGRPRGCRLSFFAHVATEALLDSALIEQDSGRLDRYYSELAKVDADLLQTVVNKMAQGSTARLSWFVDRFRSFEFLRDYADDGRLLLRLNQVMRRARLRELPEGAGEALRAGRPQIRRRVQDLLPPKRQATDLSQFRSSG